MIIHGSNSSNTWVNKDVIHYICNKRDFGIGANVMIVRTESE